MRSLQLKFSALLVVLLVLASVGLTVIATKHERAALEAEVAKRGRALATSLAGAAHRGADRKDFTGWRLPVPL